MRAESDRQRDQRVTRVLWYVLLINLVVTVSKLVVGTVISSIAMIADGFHSLTDTGSNIVGLVAIAVAQRPPDREHPYGHRRFETLAALVIGGLLALVAWEVLKACFERLRSGQRPEVTLLGFGVMIVAMAASWVVSRWERKEGEELSSELLLADAEHTRSDVLTSLVVVVSLIGSRLGYPWLDPVAAIAITGIIVTTAFRILRVNSTRLADTAIVPAQEIRDLALQVPGVLSVHKIRSRGTAHAGHADLHIQVRADLPLDTAHGIGHQVADRIRERFGISDVLVHVEPPTD